MMTPATYDLTDTRAIRRQRDYILPLVLTNANGTPVNLVGCTARAQIRAARARDATLLVAFSAVITDAVNGRITLSMTDTQTAGIDAASKAGFWDLVITSAGALDYNYLEGRVQIIDTVTSLTTP